MILYGNALSTYCAKVRVVLRHKRLAYTDREPPGGYGSQAYRAIVAMGTVPGLVDGEVVLSESEAIVEYLEECHPTPAMLPGDAARRAHVRSLSRIHDCWVEPQLRALYAQLAPAQRDPARVSAHCRELRRRLGEFARYARPAPYLGAAQLSLADCAWPTTFLQAQMLLPALGEAFELPGALRRWRAVLDAHPAVAPGLDPCAAAMAAWMHSKGVAPASYP